MATQTSNLGLTKPAYSETADIADINNNMDKVDAAVNGVQNGIAILANGNVHSAVTSGQYVYVRNHGTLAEGLYTATTNISTNATLSTSNLTAVPNNGALNTLRDDISSLNSKIATVATTPEMPSEYGSSATCNAYKAGNVVTVSVNATNISVTLQQWSRISIATLPVGYRPKTDIKQPVTISTTEGIKQEMLVVYTSGNISITEDLVGANLTINNLRFFITFVV